MFWDIKTLCLYSTWLFESLSSTEWILHFVLAFKSCSPKGKRLRLEDRLLTELENQLFESPGFAERLTKEMRSLIPPKMATKMLEPPERKQSVWIGGSIMEVCLASAATGYQSRSTMNTDRALFIWNVFDRFWAVYVKLLGYIYYFVL